MIKNFKETAKLYQLEELRSRIKVLNNNYIKLQKEFNDICDQLDNCMLNEQNVQEITTHLTIHLASMDIIDKKIKEISEIINNIKIEFSN